MIDDWQMKYKIERDYKNNKNLIIYDGKKIAEYPRVWNYSVFYTENSIHFIVEENGKYRWVTYGKNGNLLNETESYNEIKILGRNLYKANGMEYQLEEDGREINLNLEKVIKEHDRNF